VRGSLLAVSAGLHAVPAQLKRMESPSVKLDVPVGFESRNQVWKFHVSPDETARLMGGGNRVRTSNGSGSINLPGLPSVSLDASTSNGSVVSRIPMTTISSEKTHLRATVGNGDVELSVQTSNGSITFR